MNKKQDIESSVEIKKKIEKAAKTIAITNGDDTTALVIAKPKKIKKEVVATDVEKIATVETTPIAQAPEQTLEAQKTTEAIKKVDEKEMVEEAQVFEKIDKEAAAKESTIDYQLETLWTNGRKEMLSQERSINKNNTKSSEVIKKKTEK